MLRLSVVIFCCVLFFTSVLILGFEILNRIDVAPAIVKLQATQRTYLEDFLKDQDDLSTIELFNRNYTQNNNAGTLLNPLFSWHPGFNGEDSVLASGELLEIKERYKEAALRYDKEWMQHNSWFNQATFDFSILEKLRNYDHWDLELESPIEKVGVSEPYLNGIEIPIPDVTNLTVLAQFYLMKAVDTKNTVQALEDIRHLASLMLSTENLSVEMSGLRLLDYERVAYNYYVKHGLIKEASWEPFSSAILSQATRAWPATAGYIRLFTQDTAFNKVFKERKPTGLCAAVNTAIPHDLLLKSMLHPRIWPEPSFSHEYARHEELIRTAKSQCRLKYVTRLMSASASYNRVPVPFPYQYLPFSRRTYGMKLATVGFTGFEIYADPLNRQREPSAQ